MEYKKIDDIFIDFKSYLKNKGKLDLIFNELEHFNSKRKLFYYAK